MSRVVVVVVVVVVVGVVVDIDAQAARDSTASDIWWTGVRRLVVANGPNIFQMLLVETPKSFSYKSALSAGLLKQHNELTLNDFWVETNVPLSGVNYRLYSAISMHSNKDASVKRRL